MSVATCCEKCGSIDNLEHDHTIPLALGGDDTPANSTVLCAECHLIKTRIDMHDIAKVERIRKKRLGIPKGRWKKKLDGRTVRE